jgi:hypothetical protein
MATTEQALENDCIKQKKSSKCFASGKKYQTKICENINNIEYNGKRCYAVEVEGAKAGKDIVLKLPQLSELNNGIETKNGGAFEGGCKKMIYNNIDKRLEIAEESIHKTILGDSIIYEGMNLPWYEGKKSMEEWDKVKSIFNKDIYLAANNDAISKYYREGGVAYIQIENRGLYHTGEDPLNIGVPYFECEIKLRIRSTKHKKNGICTDVTAALQYNKRQLVKSQFSLDGILPPSMKKVAEE